MTAAKKTALVVAPGRGTYGKGELGSIARLHGARFGDIIAGFDAQRRERGQPTVSELDGADPAHRPAGQTQVVEHVEVFQERRLDVEGQRDDFAAAVRGRDPSLGERQWGQVEELRDRLPLLDLDQQDAAPACRERQRQ